MIDAREQQSEHDKLVSRLRKLSEELAAENAARELHEQNAFEAKKRIAAYDAGLFGDELLPKSKASTPETVQRAAQRARRKVKKKPLSQLKMSDAAAGLTESELKELEEKANAARAELLADEI